MNSRGDLSCSACPKRIAKSIVSWLGRRCRCRSSTWRSISHNASSSLTPATRKRLCGLARRSRRCICSYAVPPPLCVVARRLLAPDLLRGCMAATSIGRNAVEASCGWQTAERSKIRQEAVRLNLEDSDGAGSRVERIQERAIGAHRDVQIGGPGRI